MPAAEAQIEAVATAASAAETMFERYRDQLLAYCRRQLGTREEAEDAVQATFLNAFRALRRGVVPQSDTAWLYSIAVNVCRERLRARVRRGRVELAGAAEELEERAADLDRRADELLRLRDAFASMPERQREAIVMREWRGLSYGEIGERLGLSQSAVETLLFRARRTLARGLEKPPVRSRLRKLFDLSWLASAAKGVFGGGVAVKGAAAVAVVVAAGGVAGGASAPPRDVASTVASASAVPARAPSVAPTVAGAQASATRPATHAGRRASAPPKALRADAPVTAGRLAVVGPAAAVVAPAAAAVADVAASVAQSGAEPAAAAAAVRTVVDPVRARTKRVLPAELPAVPPPVAPVPTPRPPVAVPPAPAVPTPELSTPGVPVPSPPVPSVPPPPGVPIPDVPTLPELPGVGPIPPVTP